MLSCNMLLEALRFKKGAGAPWASEDRWVVGFQPLLFLGMVGVVCRKRDARRDRDLKEMLRCRVCHRRPGKMLSASCKRIAYAALPPIGGREREPFPSIQV